MAKAEMVVTVKDVPEVVAEIKRLEAERDAALAALHRVRALCDDPGGRSWGVFTADVRAAAAPLEGEPE